MPILEVNIMLRLSAQSDEKIILSPGFLGDEYFLTNLLEGS